MTQTTVTFGVNYHDPEKMNQPDVTRHFPTQHQLDVFVHETLEKIAPKARNVEKFKITSIKEKIS